MQRGTRFSGSSNSTRVTVHQAINRRTDVFVDISAVERAGLRSLNEATRRI